MNEDLMKSLASLIDETLAEVEALKKSDRFSASEIKLGGPGSGIAGKDPQGSLGKEEDDKKEDKEEDEEDEDEDKDMDKGEGVNHQADPNAGHHTMAAKSEGSAEKSEGQNRQADPNGGHHAMGKAEEKDEKKKDKKDEDKDDKEEKMSWMKKSAEEANTLLKSYVDQRLSPIEGKLEAIMGLVKELADAPVPSKSQSYKHVTPLKKSSEEGEGTALTKSALVDKLFELKKSGTNVETTDIASAELGSSADLVKIATKYNIK